jgi:hypothetical protein
MGDLFQFYSIYPHGDITEILLLVYSFTLNSNHNLQFINGGTETNLNILALYGGLHMWISPNAHRLTQYLQYMIIVKNRMTNYMYT